MSELLLDRAGRRRSPATMPGFQADRPPRDKACAGLRGLADRVEALDGAARGRQPPSGGTRAPLV